MASSLLPSDKKAIEDARSFARERESNIAQNQENFSGKDSIGLWWDAKGLFRKSDKKSVLRHMEDYREFYEEIATCIEKAEKGDADSLQSLVSISEKLEKLERDAECEVRRNTSNAIRRILREFIGSKYALESKLNRVECVVLHKKVERAEEAARKSAGVVEEMKEQMTKLNVDSEKRCGDLLEANAELRNLMEESSKEFLEENQKLKNVIEKSSKEFLEENQKLKNVMEKEKEELRNVMKKEKEDLRNVMEKEKEELRNVMVESNSRADQRCNELLEENQKLKDLMKEEKEELRNMMEEKMEDMIRENNLTLQKFFDVMNVVVHQQRNVNTL